MFSVYIGGIQEDFASVEVYYETLDTLLTKEVPKYTVSEGGKIKKKDH